MGFLHAGHVSLLERARRDCDFVVMSLFVNPTQFGPGEDLERYPRDQEGDERMAAEAGVDLIYAPAVEEVYPEGFATTVEVGGLTEVLCGDPESRGSEHFRGVTTVVAKLLNAVGPDVAYFGQKDAQQAIVIKRMATDLDFPVRIDVCPTVREPDGLALSSRNAYLEPADRERAPALQAALRAAAEAARSGAPAEEAIAEARRVLAGAGVEPEYLEARDAERLEPIESFNGRPVLLALAAQVGGARLIDNVIIEPAAAPPR
jgi:pantoate--beta-alanine ligase